MDQATLLKALDAVLDPRTEKEEGTAAYWLLYEFIMTRAEKEDVPVLLKKRS